MFVLPFMVNKDVYIKITTIAYIKQAFTEKYQDTGEDQVDSERNGGAQSTKTCRR